MDLWVELGTGGMRSWVLVLTPLSVALGSSSVKQGYWVPCLTDRWSWGTLQSVHLALAP